jgi:hypothetical protein
MPNGADAAARDIPYRHTAACGAEDGHRPPAGDAPAAAGGGLTK